MQLTNKDNDEDHLDSPRELQDEGVPVDNANISVDQSFGSERAVLHGMWEPEYESEDENDQNIFYFIFNYHPSSGYMSL